MAFDFDNNINNNVEIELDFGAIVYKILSTIINDRNKKDNNYFAELEYENNKIIYNSTLKDIIENFQNWYPYFLQHVDMNKMIVFYPYHNIVQRDKEDSKIGISMSHLCVKINPNSQNDNHGHASTFNHYHLAKTYKDNAIKNNIAKYIRNKEMASINIPIVNFDFDVLYTYLYVRMLFFGFYFGKIDTHTISITISANSDCGEIFKLANNPNECIDFIYKIGNNESNSVIANIFKQVKIYNFIDIIKYKLISTGHLSKADLEKWAKIIDYSYNLYDICHKIVESNIIKH